MTPANAPRLLTLWERRKPRFAASAAVPIAAYAAPTGVLGMVGVLGVVMVLAGCQRTLFEIAPATASGCAPLVGHWQSLGSDGERDGEVEATVSVDCSLRLVEHGAEGPREYLPLALQVATQPARWLWVDAGEANAALAVGLGPLDGDGGVYAFGWSLDGEVLTLVPPAHRRLAHQVVDGELEGAVHAEDRALTVRVEGEAGAIAALLAADGTLDPAEAVRFRRSAVAP